MKTNEWREGVHQITESGPYKGMWRVCAKIKIGKLFLGIFPTQEKAQERYNTI